MGFLLLCLVLLWVGLFPHGGKRTVPGRVYIRLVFAAS